MSVCVCLCVCVCTSQKPEITYVAKGVWGVGRFCFHLLKAFSIATDITISKNVRSVWVSPSAERSEIDLLLQCCYTAVTGVIFFIGNYFDCS